MRPSSEFRHGASSSLASSTHFRFQHGTFGELSEEEDNTVTMATMIEQHKMEEEGTPQHNNLGSKKEEHVTIQGRKEEECVAIQIEPDAPPMPEEAGIWVNAVLILLLVPAVIFGLHFSGVI